LRKKLIPERDPCMKMEIPERDPCMKMEEDLVWIEAT
jgi:hypothetical protein